MIYRYNAPESQRDTRYLYQWAILEMALQKTKAKYGMYSMIASKPMSESRQITELKQASSEITVMYLDTSPELEQTLVPIRIPVDRNLVGYRVLLIRKEDVQKYTDINTLEQLQAVNLGQGQDWIDVKILRANGLKVTTGSSYEGLFNMLIYKRFDAFPRGAVEVIGEYEARKDELPQLYIDQHVLIYYPLPMYFWFSKTDEGKRLSARVEEGMRKMISDGTYDSIFRQYHSENIRKLKLKQRKLIKLENPLLVPETPFDEKRLWFNLDSYMEN